MSPTLFISYGLLLRLSKPLRLRQDVHGSLGAPRKALGLLNVIRRGSTQEDLEQRLRSMEAEWDNIFVNNPIDRNNQGLPESLGSLR